MSLWIIIVKHSVDKLIAYIVSIVNEVEVQGAEPDVVNFRGSAQNLVRSGFILPKGGLFSIYSSTHLIIGDLKLSTSFGKSRDSCQGNESFCRLSIICSPTLKTKDEDEYYFEAFIVNGIANPFL